MLSATCPLSLFLREIQLMKHCPGLAALLGVLLVGSVNAQQERPTAPPTKPPAVDPAQPPAFPPGFPQQRDQPPGAFPGFPAQPPGGPGGFPGGPGGPGFPPGFPGQADHKELVSSLIDL